MKYILLFTILATSSAFAQSNFKDGFIITSKGDTISGKINYKEWGQNPKHIQLRTDKDIIVYSPEEIKGFEIEGYCKFSTYTGPISNNRVMLSQLGSEIDTTFITDKVFLRHIINSPAISLLFYKDALKGRFFIQTESGKISELLYFPYVNQRSRQLIKYAKYKDQLRNLAHELKIEDDGLLQKIESSVYSEPSLKEVIMAFNKNNGIIFSQTKIPSRSFFIAASVNTPVLKFAGKIPLSENSKSKSFVGPVFGFGLNIYKNPTIEKLLFRSSLSFNLQKFETSADYIVSPGRTARDIYQSHVLNISFTPTILYNIYNAKTLKLYLNTGFSVNSPIEIDSYYSSEIIESFHEPELANPPSIRKIKLSKVWYGIPIEIGVSKNQISLFAAYTTAIGGINSGSNISYKISYRAYNAGIRYAFAKKF